MHPKPTILAASLIAIACAGPATAQLLPESAETLVSPFGPPLSGLNFGSTVVWGDVDDDGRDDLITVVEDPEAFQLRLVVFRSLPGGGFQRELGPLLLAENEADVALATCDGPASSIPGDQIVIGLPSATDRTDMHNEAGQLWVYNMLIPESPLVMLELDQSDIPGSVAETNDNFGAAVGTGDFDGDGFCDIAVSSPGEAQDGLSDAGVVHVRLSDGAPSWTVAIGADDLIPGTPVAAGDRFGSVLAAGPIKPYSGEFGSRRHVLAVGVPDADDPFAGAGNVWLLNHDDGENPPFTGQVLTAASVGETPASFDRFGTSLAIGDLNGDAVFDLAIGVLQADVAPGPVSSGRVIVVPGSSNGDAATAFASSVTVADLGLTPTSGDDFGRSLAIGRFSGGVAGDLIVGIPGADTNRGRLGVFHGLGSATQLLVEPGFTVRQGDMPGEDEQSDDRLGWTLAAGDANGDGDPELAVGVPFEDLDAARGLGAGDNLGVVHVLPIVSHLQRAEVLAEVGELFGGQGPIDFIEAPRGNPTGENAQVMTTVGSLDLATTTTQVDASSNDLLPRLGLDSSGNRAWMDLANGDLVVSSEGVVFEDGTTAPVGIGGIFGFSGQDDLRLRGDRQLYLLTELSAPVRTALLHADLVTDSADALLEVGDTVDGQIVTEIPQMAVSPDGGHWAAEVSRSGLIGVVRDGELLIEPTRERGAGGVVLDELAVGNDGQVVIVTRTDTFDFGAVQSYVAGLVLSPSDSLGSISLSEMVPRSVAISAHGEVVSGWSIGEAAGGLLALSCPETPSQRMLVLHDALDTDGDGLADARVVGLDSEPGGAPEVADDGTIVVRALVQRDEDPLGQPVVLLRMPSPVCPSFADGFESGTTSAWSATIP